MDQPDERDDLVAVGIYHVRHEAEVARAMLEANGIETLISADDLGGTHPILAAVSGVRLLVRRRQEQEAAELLRVPSEE